MPPTWSLFIPMPPTWSLFVPMPPTWSLFIPMPPTWSLFVPMPPTWSLFSTYASNVEPLRTHASNVEPLRTHASNVAMVLLDQTNVLMMTHVCQYLPARYHHSYICCAGSTGYCALKETLQNGKPGHTLLIESKDLRDMEELSLIHISEPTRLLSISYAVFCLKKKKNNLQDQLQNMHTMH
eukprot:TRINITY_DN10361_c0_g1_i1.p1 TRINITY_DN10361_c0_g1~~TRINITY_DN10361_c0_g1_i1.p1  ORF type:complete len:181 (-),score=33.52 TRINITY_DN10361_c0_g1_i1:1-543(-)